MGINFTTRFAAIPNLLNRAPTGSLSLEQDRLDSWKEIAWYLKREVRTVQLWEKNEGLPVHRHFHKSLGSVFAFRSEIEKWKRLVTLARSESEAGRDARKLCRHPIRIHVLPIVTAGSCAELRERCDVVVATTLHALQEVDPGRLTASLCEPADLPEGMELDPNAPADKNGEYLLRCHVAHEGAEIRITVFLESLLERNAIWSFGYECSEHGWEDARCQVSEQIVQCVWLKLISLPKSAQGRSEGKRGSQEAYLKGRYFWKQRRHDNTGQHPEEQM